MSKESVEAVLKRVKEAQPKVEVVANSQVTAPIEGCGDGNGLQVDGCGGGWLDSTERRSHCWMISCSPSGAACL
jgi:hypothetical protein